MDTLDIPVRKSRSHSMNSNVRKTFELLDADGDGFISRQDLARGLQSLDPSLTNKDLQTIVEQLDQGHTGTINYKSFQTGFQKFLLDRKQQQRKGMDGDGSSLSYPTNDTMNPVDEDHIDYERELAIKQELQTQFNEYAEMNGEDAITLSQFETLLKGYLGKLTEDQDENDITEQITTIWNELPKTKSGRITYNSMLNALMGESGGTSPSLSARTLQPITIPTTPNSQFNHGISWDTLEKRMDLEKRKPTNVLQRLLKQGPLSPIRGENRRKHSYATSYEQATPIAASPMNNAHPTSFTTTHGLDDTMIHHGESTIHESSSSDLEDSKHCHDLTPQKQTNIMHLLSTLESPVSNVTNTTNFFTPTRSTIQSPTRSTIQSPISPDEMTPKYRPSRKNQIEPIDWNDVNETVNEQQLQNLMIQALGRLLNESELNEIHKLLLFRQMDVISRDLMKDVIFNIKQQYMYGKNGTPKYGGNERSSVDPVEAFAVALTEGPSITGTATRQRFGTIDMEEMASVIAVNRKLLADSQKTVSHISLLKSRHDQLDEANSNLMNKVHHLESQILHYISERDEAQAQTRLIQAKLTIAEQQLKENKKQTKNDEHDKLSALYMSAIEKQCKQEIELVHHSEQLQKSERENAAYQIQIKNLEKEMEQREKTHQELIRQLRAENASLWEKNAELEQENREHLRIQASLVQDHVGELKNYRAEGRPLSEQLAEVAEHETTSNKRQSTNTTRNTTKNSKGLTIHHDNNEQSQDPQMLQKLLTYQTKIKQLEMTVQSREQEIEYLKAQIILWSPALSPKREPTSPTTTTTTEPVHMSPLPEHDSHAELKSLQQHIDALTKKNEALQLEIDRLTKENQEMAKILAKCCNGAKCIIC